MTTAKKLIAAAGAAGAEEALYVEDVFSTTLYKGDNSTQTVTTGIDVLGEGGLIWVKARSFAGGQNLIDSAQGSSYNLNSASINAPAFNSTQFTFLNNGYRINGGSTAWDLNQNNQDYCAWTFRKAPKFFDVVTYTGDSSTEQAVAHNLGSTPGCVIVKKISGSGPWPVWHRKGDFNPSEHRHGFLDSEDDFNNYGYFNNAVDQSTLFTDSVFTVRGTANGSGASFVAYVFAHNDGDGGFGEDGDQDIIKCGRYTGNGSTDGPEIDLGFEPQWLMIKRADGTQYWNIIDVMRGMPVEGNGNDSRLFPHEYLAESTSGNYVAPTPTGFKLVNSSSQLNANGSPYIYIAIRRGPMKTPESGTEVFNDTFQYGEDGKTAGYLGSPADLDIRIDTTGGGSLVRDRLRGDVYLRTQATDAEAGSQSATWDNMTGYFYYSPGTTTNTNIIHYVFKRAPGFFDVVAYTGDGVQGHNVSHNLGVAPDMMLVKQRSTDFLNGEWRVYVSGITHLSVYGSDPSSYDDNPAVLRLDDTDEASFSPNGVWDHTHPTDTYFRLGDTYHTNRSGDPYIAYLFATLAGVSKVGSYTGTGADLNVDCGFSAGARFVLIKRTDSTGDWYVWDSERGIVAGNDPYLLLNSTAAEVTSTDYIDPLSSGFTVTSSAPAALNASGGTYIFLAIA